MTPSRGAPLGNRNALKHGFYSRRFRRTELRDLEANASPGLADEISLIRIILRRLVALADSAQDLPELLAVLRVVNLLACSVNRLVKTQVFLDTSGTQVPDLLQQALEELSQEGFFDQLDPKPSPETDDPSP